MEDSGEKNIYHAEDKIQDKSPKVSKISRITQQEEKDRIDKIISGAPALHQEPLRQSLYEAYFTASSTEAEDSSRIDEIRKELDETVSDSDENNEDIMERLGRAEQELGRNLNAQEKAAIIAAHNVGENEQGKDGSEAGINNYTFSQLREKAKILKGDDEQKGFSKEERRKLMEAGIVGEERDKQDLRSTPERLVELSEAQLREQEAIRKNTDTMVQQLSELLSISAEERDILRKLSDEQMERLIQSIEFSKTTFEEYIEKSIRQGLDDPKERKTNEVVMEAISKVSAEEYETYRNAESKVRSERNRVIFSYANAVKDNFKGGEYLEDDEWSGTVEEYIRREVDRVGEVLDDLEDKFISGDLNDLEVQRELRNISKDSERIQNEANILAGIDPQERRGRGKAVKNIEELMKFIMELHPDYSEEGNYPLIYPPEHEQAGEINQGNFIQWIRDQLSHYHNQDADNPQVNFFGNISVEVESQGYTRTVNVLQMINNPGVFFKSKNGHVLNGLRDEVERTIWQYSTNRNNRIAYFQSMPLDTKIADVVAAINSNNALTKPAYEGKSPLYWNLTQSERYENETRLDARVGEGIVAGTMIYYDITDYEALKKRCAPIKDAEGKDDVSPLFDLNKIKAAAQSILISNKRPDYDKYFTEDTWAEISSWFDDNGVLKDGSGDKWIKFFNPYEPQQDTRKLELLRALIAEEISRRTGLNSNAAKYAEQWAQFQIDFMLISARGGVGAAAYNGAEKGLRMLEYYERAWSDTKPGLGNPKALGLLVAPGVDFLIGTQVRSSEFKLAEVSKATDSKGNFNKVNIVEFDEKGEPVKVSHTLKDNQEVLYVGSKIISSKTKGEIISFEEREKIAAFTLLDDKEEILENAEVKENANTGEFTVFVNGQEYKSYKPSEEDGKYTNHYELVGERKYKITKREWHFDDALGLNTKDKRVVVEVDEQGNRRYLGELKENERVDLGGNTLKSMQEVRVREKVFIGGQLAYTLKDGESTEQSGDQIWIIKDGKVIKKLWARINKDGNSYKREIQHVDVRYTTVNGEETAVEGAIQTHKTTNLDNSEIKIKKERVIEEWREHQLSTYDVLQHMDETRSEWQERINQATTKEEKDRLRKEADDKVQYWALKLEWGSDEQRQFAQNQFGRAMQLFHEYGQKFVIDPRSLYSYDEKKGFVFDQGKLQEEIGEKLIKPRRYAFRTWPHLDMSRIVRAPDPENKFEYREMFLAEAIFGRQVLETFRRKDGTIDFEFLSSRDGIKELIKTEALLRLAADEMYFEDLDMLTPRLGLQAKLAYRKGIFTLSDGISIDYRNVKNNKVSNGFFGARKISFNEYGPSFEQVYNKATGASPLSIIRKETQNAVLFQGFRGVFDAVKEVVGSAFKS